jgi:hypothetical protein
MGVRDLRVCPKCGRPHPKHWAVPFTLTMGIHIVVGLRDAMKRGEVCEACHRDEDGNRRPTSREVVEKRYLGARLRRR